ncbi:unnamed protein product [Urochloa decumbens]|uniref:Secreted protein n=1 Tax=Urochloa decumbens TaxID=240449 RepID=A0ABC8WTK6_9POAL
MSVEALLLIFLFNLHVVSIFGCMCFSPLLMPETCPWMTSKGDILGSRKMMFLEGFGLVWCADDCSCC